MVNLTMGQKERLNSIRERFESLGVRDIKLSRGPKWNEISVDERIDQLDNMARIIEEEDYELAPSFNDSVRI